MLNNDAQQLHQYKQNKQLSVLEKKQKYKKYIKLLLYDEKEINTFSRTAKPALSVTLN